MITLMSSIASATRNEGGGTMEYRELGKTGLRVSRLGFGCGNVGGLIIRGTHQDRVRAVARAMEAGINYFDTAPSYGNGQSEERLGEVLHELKAEVYVGTKVRITPAELDDLPGAITRSIDASLRRLGRESVDLIQLHNHITQRRQPAEPTLAVEDVTGEIAETFRRIQGQGKVRYYGITTLGDTPALHEVIDSEAFYTAQVCYNLLNPSAGRPVPDGFPYQDFGRLLERASTHRMGCIGIRVLAAGALSGDETRHPVAVPSVAPIGTGADYRSDVRLARTLGFLTEEGYAANLVEASIRFAWSNQGVSTVLVGYSSLDHLEQALTAAERGPLPDAAIGRLRQAWEAFPA
jgi:L-galactose dehydrogenase/L-glyceraldehyde 3-phosphate reductase